MTLLLQGALRLLACVQVSCFEQGGAPRAATDRLTGVSVLLLLVYYGISYDVVLCCLMSFIVEHSIQYVILVGIVFCGTGLASASTRAASKAPMQLSWGAVGLYYNNVL